MRGKVRSQRRGRRVSATLDVRSRRTRCPRGLEATAALVLLAMGWWVSGAQGCPASKPKSSLFYRLIVWEQRLIAKEIVYVKVHWCYN